MKTILLSGATGFLGSHLLKALIENDYNVVILKRSFSDTWRIKNEIDLVKSYDTDIDELEDVFKENSIDIIIHCATSYGNNNQKVSNIIESNLVFPLKLLELSIFYNIKNFFNTDTFFNPNMKLPLNQNYYVYSKKKYLEVALELIGNTPCKFVNIKLEHLYGTLDNKNKFIPSMIENIKQKERIDLTKGEQKRDFIYIDDCCEAYLKILDNFKKIPFQNNYFEFELGTGSSIEIREILKKMKEIANSNTFLNFGALEYRENEKMDSKADISFLKSLGWNPKITLKEGLKKIIENDTK